MYAPPNEVYTAFSFIGFVLCAIPFYWHLEVWNTGTCLYMVWTGLGCLIQCINSIIWNHNMTIKAPVYCDIVTRIQVGLNVAIPACALCINRRLYYITNMKVGMITHGDKRRTVIVDLLIGLGIPILQMILHYVISGHRFNIYEDYGPEFAVVLMPLTFFLLYAWPLAIGCVSSVYGVLTIYSFIKHEHRFRQAMSANTNLNRSRYFRLIALSGVEALGTIPVSIFWIVFNAKTGVRPWVSWKDTHSNYSHIVQFASSVWKNDHAMAIGAEGFRWSLVACAFVFFAFFGFADEARQHYRLVYMSFARRLSSFMGLLMPHRLSQVPQMNSSKGGVAVSIVTTGERRRNPTVVIGDQLSISSISISIASSHTSKPDPEITELAPSDPMASSSVVSFEIDSESQSQSSQLAEIPATVPTASHTATLISHPDVADTV